MWLTELENNQIGFAPFNHDCDMKDSDGLAKIKNVVPHYPGFNPFRKKATI